MNVVVVLGVVAEVVDVVNRDNSGTGRARTFEDKGQGWAGEYEPLGRKSEVAVVRKTRNCNGDERASGGRVNRGRPLKMERRSKAEAGGDGWALHHRGCVSGIPPN
jgi:hypothetical protein